MAMCTYMDTFLLITRVATAIWMVVWEDFKLLNLAMNSSCQIARPP